ncbi:hypothetical protein NCLIV_000320 [Neospora caninum Liverpool]|uniref:Uncharacterized protein n=1 Tax=Neospora caninum (strain Liverpool) TaxID=572307 RepID=F0V743_NEOCL|nr:hypothetical protein NCLIV_000320 [Neospora caninum Liverpool]CBZ49534.1 hypothetical protein NCLIV_000320 [Neospora caninum Liverpool]CEL64113.1 TPA: hypothetical protein BN1204_000320 [Neospora caninum Liverpool]|eukprot:XP_003879569.1 hypothetical protein NCLIV_000320 [Neospora caninum Liverpool]
MRPLFPAIAGGPPATALSPRARSEGDRRGDDNGDTTGGKREGEEARSAHAETADCGREEVGEADCFDADFYPLPASLCPGRGSDLSSSALFLQRRGGKEERPGGEEERPGGEATEGARWGKNEEPPRGVEEAKLRRVETAVGSDVAVAASSVAALAAFPPFSATRVFCDADHRPSSPLLSLFPSPARLSSLPRPVPRSPRSADASVSAHLPPVFPDAHSLELLPASSCLADLLCSSALADFQPSAGTSPESGDCVRTRAERDRMIAHLFRPRPREARRERRKYRQPYEKDGLLRMILGGCLGKRIALVLAQGGAVEGRFVRCIDRRHVSRRSLPLPFFQRMQERAAAGETDGGNLPGTVGPLFLAGRNPLQSTGTVGSPPPPRVGSEDRDVRRRARESSPAASDSPPPGPPPVGCTYSGKCERGAGVQTAAWQRASGPAPQQRRNGTGGDLRMRRFQWRRTVSRIVLEEAVVYRHTTTVFAAAHSSVVSAEHRQAKARRGTADKGRKWLSEQGLETRASSPGASSGVPTPRGERRDGREFLASVCVKASAVAFIVGTAGDSVRGLDGRVKKKYVDAVKNKVFDRTLRLGSR